VQRWLSPQKTFSSKDPEQELTSESLQKQNPVQGHSESVRIVRKHLFEHLEGNRFVRKHLFEHPEDRRIVRRPVGRYYVDGGFVR
jgi:signal-transduction protein with cAMP-binding, CBS, and nucleotidyltransferase domain